MSTISGKIDPMKSMNWPVSFVLAVSIVVMGTLAIMEKDIDAIVNAITFLFVALGYAELREIKSNTNGVNAKLIEELAEYRRSSARVTDRAMDSPSMTSAPPVSPVPPTPPSPPPLEFP